MTRRARPIAVLSVLLASLVQLAAATGPDPLGLEQRALYQRRLEDLAHRHRTAALPADRRPSREAALTDAQIEEHVREVLRESAALELYWHRPVSAAQIQSEMERITVRSGPGPR
jgi:hypothetical protein